MSKRKLSGKGYELPRDREMELYYLCRQFAQRERYPRRVRMWALIELVAASVWPRCWPVAMAAVGTGARDLERILRDGGYPGSFRDFYRSRRVFYMVLSEALDRGLTADTFPRDRAQRPEQLTQR